MCGIAGIYNLKGNSISNKDINTLTDAVKHRGPDGKGVWINKNVAFGHRRLAILDLTPKGKQPMSYSNERYWITLNGEIYNFVEIKDKLRKKGYKFVSESDTEVILASYQEWGEKMLNMFNGMWAFAIYDNTKKKLMLSRDRFGVKPLYYYRDKERIIFSSEVQAIHKILGKEHPLNEKIIKDIASGSFANHGSKFSYLKGVCTLPGGSNLTVRSQKVKIKNWYKLRKISIPAKFVEQSKHLRDLFYDSCRIRLRSDVPIGTCLSGGLDSASIAATINSFGQVRADRFSKYSHRTFCASFPKSPIDESKKARLLAKRLSSKLDVVDVLPPDKMELENLMSKCDGPMHALAFVPIMKLYEHIKQQNITVTLDGAGPDEMLGGYRPVTEALMAAIELKKPHWFFDIYNIYSAQGETPQFSSKWYVRKVAGILMFKEFIIFGTKLLALFNKTKMAEDLKKFLNRDRRPFAYAKKSNEHSNSLDKELFKEFFQSPLPGILNQHDRCSMAYGVECRMPFLDYRIVEFVFSLPPESKVGHGYTKRILREAMKDILPDDIRLTKTKVGFNAPIVDWFTGHLKEFMLTQMDKPEFIKSKYFDGKKIKKDFDVFLNSPNPQWDDAWKFWPPVHLAWWMNYNKIK